MRLSKNERAFLAAMRDNDFRTIAQVTQYCGFTRAMGYHYFRALLTGGLIEDFQPTYLGYKMLDDKEIVDADTDDHFQIRLESVPKDGHHLEDFSPEEFNKESSIE